MTGIRSAIAELDEILQSGGIITMRSNRSSPIAHLLANIIIQSHDPLRKTLYLHFVDYHRRYWTIDPDSIIRIAKKAGRDFDSIAQNLYFMRAFTRDNAENEDNWKMIDEFSQNLNFIILDTLSDLYFLQKQKPVFQKTFAYALGRFARLCMKNRCSGIIIDSVDLPIHPYLGEISSTIIEFYVKNAIHVHLRKHPCLGERSFYLQQGNQRTLGEWFD
jgi:hypothetical protein